MTPWERLTVYVNESSHWRGQPVYMAIVEAAKQHGMAGATVLRGIEGFGLEDQGRIHSANILELSSNLPVVVLIVDRQEAIAQFMPILKEMVTHGLVTQETLNVVHPAISS